MLAEATQVLILPRNNRRAFSRCIPLFAGEKYTLRALCNFLVILVVEKRLNTRNTKELHKDLKVCK